MTKLMSFKSASSLELSEFALKKSISSTLYSACNFEALHSKFECIKDKIDPRSTSVHITFLAVKAATIEVNPVPAANSKIFEFLTRS